MHILRYRGLLNSRYKSCVEHLEKSLPNYLQLTQKKYALGLIEQAGSLLSIPLANDVKEIQRQQKQIDQMLSKLGKFLDLFFYLDCDQQKRIRALYTFMNEEEALPHCNQLFTSFCQNLSLLQRDKQTLIALKHQLLQKRRGLQEISAKINADLRPKLSREKELFLEHRAVDLWSIGENLLKNGIFKIFSYRKYLQQRAPNDFVRAVNIAAHNQTSFNQLIDTISELPSPFISKVWEIYLGPKSILTDISDFMRLLVAKIPDARFHQLLQDLKSSASPKQTISLSLTDFIEEQIGENPDLTSLRDWAQRALVEGNR